MSEEPDSVMKKLREITTVCCSTLCTAVSRH